MSAMPGTDQRRVMLKHFSLDHKFVVVDNEELWIEDAYRDDNGNLHLKIGGSMARAKNPDVEVTA